MLIALAMGLSGCMSGNRPDLALPFAGKSRPEAETEVTRAEPAGVFAEAQSERGEEHRSSLIDALISRRSVLPDGSPYDEIARAVLATSARGAEAELLRARMRDRAADKNWLPRLGPNVSLTSMGSFVASLVLDQMLFDNGLRAAERDFARADVEVAAVTLAEEQNNRVHSGLTLYITAQEAREKAAASGRAVERMRELERVIAARVAGGVSDRSEHQVIAARLAELEAARDTETARAATAMAELRAMSSGSVESVNGLTRLVLPFGSRPQGLSLLLASAEMERDVAAAAMQRAGLIPGVAASAQLGNGGGAGVRLTSDQGIGFGMFDNMAASDASAEAARRKLSQAQEDANRRLAALERELQAQQERAAQAEGLAARGRANAELFERQMKAGTRTVLDVAGLVESQARLEESAIGARYEIARSEIEIARLLGLLADGDRL